VAPQSPAEFKMAELLVEALNLEDIDAKDIDPDELLFGDGLGLDSIDALEIGLALQKRYGITLNSDSEETRKHFANVDALAALVESQRTK